MHNHIYVNVKQALEYISAILLRFVSLAKKVITVQWKGMQKLQKENLPQHKKFRKLTSPLNSHKPKIQRQRQKLDLP